MKKFDVDVMVTANVSFSVMADSYEEAVKKAEKEIEDDAGAHADFSDLTDIEVTFCNECE